MRLSPTAGVRVPLGVLIAALAAAAVLGGGGKETVDPEAAEKFVRDRVAAHGVAKVKSVDCPSDVEAKGGTDFDCDLTLTDAATESETRSGTITLHITADGEKLQTYGNRDVHVR